MTCKKTILDTMYKTEHALNEIKGLAEALDQLAFQHSALSRSGGENAAINCVILALRRAIKEASKSHEAEFKALRDGAAA
ncbi:hypothetical protein [Shimia aestuarii]|uniref:hypothetical protein n=1 Tax=Shimia aestuarii TaxID=254406 RepID=UPI001FB5436E|nr:hypothetical protein [Shimia aestuarii]